MTDTPPDRTTEPPRSRSRRSSAAIATAVTLPLTLILAFALARPTDKSHDQPTTAPVTVTAPPANSAVAAPCNKVLAALPTALGALTPRTVKSEPASPYVLAWGDPPVVLRCGVARPSGFLATSLVFLAGVYWFQTAEGSNDVFTAIDRAVFVEVRVPKAQVNQPLDPLGKAIAKVLPAICVIPEHPADVVPDSQLCSRR